MQEDVLYLSALETFNRKGNTHIHMTGLRA